MKGVNSGTAPHLLTGRSGEDTAENYLLGNGLRLLERNWKPKRPGRGEAGLEIDLVSQDGDTLVFVEVKTRNYAPGSAFSPQDAFTMAKRKKLFKAVTLYLNEKDLWQYPCRLDLLCVTIYPDQTRKLEHFENVLTLAPARDRRTYGGGNAPWQPW